MKNARQCLAMAARAIACGDSKSAAKYLAKSSEFQDDLTSFYNEVFRVPTETALHGNSPSGNTLAPSLHASASSYGVSSELKSIVDDVAREYAMASYSEVEEHNEPFPKLDEFGYTDVDFGLEMGVASTVSSSPVRFKQNRN